MSEASIQGSRNSQGGQPILYGVDVKGRVIGRMLDMHVTQSFVNPLDLNTEVVYTFPLPYQAVLLGLEVELNGEVLTGVVKGRSQGRTDYEEALSEGNSSVMVSVNPDSSYTLELGNLMGKETCHVRLHYVQVLQVEQGSLRLTLPTTIAPRYGDPVRQGRFEPHAVPVVDAGVEYPFNITLSVMGELLKAQIGSPSHKVAIRHVPQPGSDSPYMAEITLAAKSWLDRDFVLTFNQLLSDSMGLACWDAQETGVGVIMASFSPKLPKDIQADRPVHMKVLVDCSGSMAGDSIQAARRALQGILKGLKTDDRFSLSRFGDGVEHRSKALWKVAPASMAAARRWVEQLEADLGGTEMERAIHSTLALPGAKGSDILLVTDGEIHAVDGVLKAAKQSGHRFFVVGIGSSAAEVLLRRLAEETGGSAEFVAPGEHVEDAILRLFHRMRSPSIRDATVQWPPECDVLIATQLPRNIHDGGEFTVYARVRAPSVEALSTTVSLYGRIGSDSSEEMCRAQLVPTYIVDASNTLARLAASQRYRQYHQEGDELPAVLRKQMAELAEQYQLVTPDTSYILVKTRDADGKAVDMPDLHQVANMLPAGWGGMGSVMYSRAVPETRNSLSAAVPSVWRTRDRSASASKIAALSDGGMDDFEIPAFLRKQADSDPVADFTGKVFSSFKRSGGWIPPADTPEFWSREDLSHFRRKTQSVYVGLTPAGLAEGLRLTPQKHWPETYQALSKIGLGQRVIDWLELVMGDGVSETLVVRSFIEVILDLELSPLNLSAPLNRWQASLSVGKETTQKQELRQRMQAAMHGVTGKVWPAAVIDFAEAGFAP